VYILGGMRSLGVTIMLHFCKSPDALSHNSLFGLSNASCINNLASLEPI